MAQLANYALITILTVLVAALLLQVVESYAAQTAARGAALRDRGCAGYDADGGIGVSAVAPDHADCCRPGRRAGTEQLRYDQPRVGQGRQRRRQQPPCKSGARQFAKRAIREWRRADSGQRSVAAVSWRDR